MKVAIRAALGIAILLLIAQAAQAQDVVRLKSGKILSGTIMRDEDMTDGFRMRLWETAGVIHVRWNQVPEMEKLRLLGLSNVPTTEVLGEMIDGVYLMTEIREVIGEIVEETETTISVKTADSPTPVLVPKSAIIRREDKKIREAEAYTPLEMIARREAEIDPTDTDAVIELAEFARGVRLYRQAKMFYEQAKELDPLSADEIDVIIEELDVLIHEQDAGKKLEDVKRLVEETKFEEALEAADDFFSEFSDTKAAE
ncbi:MAG: hypothetical protein ACYTAF_15700, partial [Planctomycetota bacterium]